MNYKISYFIIAAAMMFSTASMAAVTAEEAEQLKTTLTPLGAERAGNADGSIPAWDGGYTEVDPAFVPGKPGSKPVIKCCIPLRHKIWSNTLTSLRTV
jgi:hypothetical protein